MVKGYQRGNVRQRKEKTIRVFFFYVALASITLLTAPPAAAQETPAYMYNAQIHDVRAGIEKAVAAVDKFLNP